MLNRQDFGAAIGAAISLKIANGSARSKAEIARHFGVKPPAVSDWVSRGTISKDKLPELWRYFSDVAGPEHWGMTAAEWPSGLNSAPATPYPTASESGAESRPAGRPEHPVLARVCALDARQLARLDALLDLLDEWAPPRRTPTKRKSDNDPFRPIVQGGTDRAARTKRRTDR